MAVLSLLDVILFILSILKMIKTARESHMHVALVSQIWSWKFEFGFSLVQKNVHVRVEYALFHSRRWICFARFETIIQCNTLSCIVEFNFWTDFGKKKKKSSLNFQTAVCGWAFGLVGATFGCKNVTEGPGDAADGWSVCGDPPYRRKKIYHVENMSSEYEPKQIDNKISLWGPSSWSHFWNNF